MSRVPRPQWRACLLGMRSTISARSDGVRYALGLLRITVTSAAYAVIACFLTSTITTGATQPLSTSLPWLKVVTITILILLWRVGGVTLADIRHRSFANKLVVGQHWRVKNGAEVGKLKQVWRKDKLVWMVFDDDEWIKIPFYVLKAKYELITWNGEDIGL